MQARGEISVSTAQHGDWKLPAFEVAWIFLLFFLFAGTLPPDVGESHYLVKARHYWQPTWCAGDLFAESRDAHTAFYWTFGWVTKFCSLGVSAWIGRVVTWLLMAWSWRRLSWAIVPRPLASLLSAGLMLFFLRNFHLAGEWVVGGVEAKCFAYPLIFLALEAIAKNAWGRALLLAGAAGAFHVLVGGWTVVAIGLAWLVAGADRPPLRSLLPAAAGGLLLALPGIIPALALNWGVDKSIAREAARIYVFERLSHHLVYHSLSAANIARFQILLIVWAGLSWWMRNDRSLWRNELVVGGAVVIAFGGIAIDQMLVLALNSGQSTELAAELAAAPLLRYYWLRMGDSLVPVGLALAMVAGIVRMETSRPAVAAWLKIAAIVLAAANVADVCFQRSLQRVPPAVLQPRPTADSWPREWQYSTRRLSHGEMTANQWYADWQAVCGWIAEHTPADAHFITPREQQTFKWYAGRTEVVNWKDVPQDARGLLEWKQRLGELYPRDQMHQKHDLAAFSDEELKQLAAKYGASYIVIDRTRASRRLNLPKIYPAIVEENLSFDVYRVPVEAQR